MKCVVLFLLVALVGLAHSLSFIPDRARKGQFYRELMRNEGLQGRTDAKFWEAPIDHFNKRSNATYAQRYFVDEQYYVEGGPVFLQIGGEGTLTGTNTGFIAELAKKHGALILALEHRYYGESLPFPNPNYDEYRFLTVEQALADLNGFTEYYKTQQSSTKNTPWFAFGGSYPGALASWYRIAYPDATVGSLSSSGVTNCIVDYHGFDQAIAEAAGNTCGNDIRRIQGAFKRTIESDKYGLLKSATLMGCDKDISAEDFYFMIADSWSMVIQYSKKSSLCDAIALPEDATDEQIMLNFAKFSRDYWGSDFCTGGFYNTAQMKDPSRWDVNSRSWRYQTCAQVSYFNTAPVRGSLRDESLTVDYHIKQCEEIFGQPMFPASAQMNARYGGEFPIAHNVFYSDFSDDPWARASVTAPVGADQPFFLAKCDDCGHCMDFHASSPSDPLPLQQCRSEFETYLTKWLAEYKA